MAPIDTSSLVDHVNGRISPTIYQDEAIYQAELEQVFGRCWLFLAHDTMIPRAGDFFQTYMGEDPVLVVRQRDGSVRAFLNQCRHRGMRICRADLGNTKMFTCTYHGWTYNTAGDLVSVPHEDDAYFNEIDRSEWGPAQVRLATYKGFIFGTWDQSAPDLDTYLGEMAWYFDAFCDRWEEGGEVIPGTHKWLIDCNWKFAAEQFASDSYHAEISHASAYMAYVAPGEGLSLNELVENRKKAGFQFTSTQGHGTGFRTSPQPKRVGPVVQEWEAQVQPKIVDRLGPARANFMPGHATIFPSLAYLSNGTFRVWHPRGPNQIEVWAWGLVHRAAPEKVKDERRVEILRTFSPGGLFEQDDGENWNEIQKVLRGWRARQHPLSIQMGLGHARYDAEGFPGRSAYVFSEEAARSFYKRWSELVSGLTWAELAEIDEADRRARPQQASS
ncbi:aromatic ring-hydroxylating dioxygenase subunit alpha [Blastococcus sp. SYSU D00669]